MSDDKRLSDAEILAQLTAEMRPLVAEVNAKQAKLGAFLLENYSTPFAAALALRLAGSQIAVHGMAQGIDVPELMAHLDRIGLFANIEAPPLEGEPGG